MPSRATPTHTLRHEANDVLEAFTAADGTAEIPIEGHLVAARPR